MDRGDKNLFVAGSHTWEKIKRREEKRNLPMQGHPEMRHVIDPTPPHPTLEVSLSGVLMGHGAWPRLSGDQHGSVEAWSASIDSLSPLNRV